MKKVGIMVLIAAMILLAAIYWPINDKAITNAQIADSEDQKRLDHDKSISEEKLERIRQEVRSIQNEIEKYVAKHCPKSKIVSRSFSDPANAGIGRRGQANFDLSWITKSKSTIMIVQSFGFDHEDTITNLQRGFQGISMGEFYAAPEFVGKDSVLVKNLEFNRKNTNVGLHFVKGRVKVNTYITNFKRDTEQNEKELVEFVRAIEPLINAKPNIDDL